MTTAYIKVCPSSKETLYKHILKYPVAGVGDLDREMAQVPKDKRFLRSTAYNESLSSVVLLMTAMSRPWVGQEGIGVSSGRALRHVGRLYPGQSNYLTAKAMSKDPSTSNTPAESSTPASALSDADLERLLNREASAIQRELEVDRILNAFKLKSVFVFSPS